MGETGVEDAVDAAKDRAACGVALKEAYGVFGAKKGSEDEDGVDVLFGARARPPRPPLPWSRPRLVRAVVVSRIRTA